MMRASQNREGRRHITMTLLSEFGLNHTLEWDRFIELAQLEAFTFPAKDRIEQLSDSQNWALDISSSRQMQQETQEMVSLLGRDALWGPLSELPDPAELLQRLARNATLEIVDLSLLRRWLYACDSWIQIPREEIRGENFRRSLSQLSDPLQILRILDRVLTPEGDLSEKASPRLASLFAEIRSLKKEISVVLDQLVKTYSQRGILQEEFTDVRDGRYVIPIKISSQNEIDGIIYEASASRQTVFIEPKEVASLNNCLRQRQNDLIQEIVVVLDATSKAIVPFFQEISQTIDLLIHWDVVQAKARLGRKYSGKSIQVTEERSFQLKQTAHPLLWWSLPPDSIIRNEIEFGHPAKSLLLTGPNTGGKTVLLKTLGMAGICARTGFLFPGTDLPTVPFFDAFFADLGDSQSIEQQLSSFSGHLLKFKTILEQMTDQSLILIDELNSATDPEEGSAFGRAVLETILARNAMTVTTTHDPQLKGMALTDPRILSASMTFDESSRMPTYRLLVGIPGRSRALETAERLGIPQAVIQLAKKYLSREHQAFEALLSKLEQDSQEAHRARKEAVQLRDEAEKLKKEWLTRTETSVGEMLDKTRHKLRRILEQAQDEVRSVVKKLDDQRVSQSRKEIDTTRSKLNETFTLSISKISSALEEEAPTIAANLAKKENAPPKPPVTLQVGGKVRIPKWKSTGSILEILGDKVRVSMGTLQMTLSVQEIEPLSSPRPQPQVSQPQSWSSPPPSPPQLDLRGTRFDDAMSALESYLDQAFRSGAFAEVTIIHGLGTGALREGTHKMLGRLPYVKNFRNGGVGHGGTGATIVEFDRT